jgi:hypothetical protein
MLFAWGDLRRKLLIPSLLPHSSERIFPPAALYIMKRLPPAIAGRCGRELCRLTL